MFFWIVAALLTLGACLTVLAPFSRRGQPTVRDEDHDLEVYRDQLAELEKDAERGLIEASEAEQARAEIGRRILRLSAESEVRPKRKVSATLAGAVSMVAVLSIPLVSWGFYVAYGSPDMPAQPLQARLESSPAEASIAELVSRAEAHLAENPSDARGWEVLAPVYLRMGRGNDAAVAFRNAIRLDGATAARKTGLGEALVAVADGMVTVEAQEAFEEALALEPGNARARYFLASGYMQDGREADAVSIWQSMVAELPEESPWRGAALEALREAGAGFDAAQTGPSEDDMAAAADMPEEDRTAMINDMVASLDARLRSEPDNPAGWQQLVRSYVVLGREDEARLALERGLDALGRDTANGDELAAFALALGVAPTEIEE
jgi:cytochrome c-type biogenesis protein CcmH